MYKEKIKMYIDRINKLQGKYTYSFKVKNGEYQIHFDTEHRHTELFSSDKIREAYVYTVSVYDTLSAIFI